MITTTLSEGIPKTNISEFKRLVDKLSELIYDSLSIKPLSLTIFIDSHYLSNVIKPDTSDITMQIVLKTASKSAMLSVYQDSEKVITRIDNFITDEMIKLYDLHLHLERYHRKIIEYILSTFILIREIEYNT